MTTMPPCADEGCARRATARGYCRKHYHERWARGEFGVPNWRVPRNDRVTLLDRMKKIDERLERLEALLKELLTHP